MLTEVISQWMLSGGVCIYIDHILINLSKQIYIITDKTLIHNLIIRIYHTIITDWLRLTQLIIKVFYHS